MGDSEQRVEKLELVTDAIIGIICNEFQAEALELCKIAPEDRLDELLELSRANKGNIFCLCLDSIKYDLFKSGIITKEQFPNFGSPFTDDI